jgi:hypothetical protein
LLWWPRAGTLRQPRGWNPRCSHGASLSAKLIHGFADIELTGVGLVCNFHQLAAELDLQGVDFEKNEPHLCVRKSAPRLDPSADLDDQSEAAGAFVAATLQQHTWWHDVGCGLVEDLIKVPDSRSG